MPLELIEIPAGKRGKNADIARILQKKAKLCYCRAKRQQNCYPRYSGKRWDTKSWEQLESWKPDGRDVSILIGGPEGLSPA